MRSIVGAILEDNNSQEFTPTPSPFGTGSGDPIVELSRPGLGPQTSYRGRWGWGPTERVCDRLCVRPDKKTTLGTRNTRP